MVSVTFDCPGCGATGRAAIVPGQSVVRCTKCPSETALRANAFDGKSLSACAICGTTDLYVQKDFPHRLGLAIVFAGIVISSIAWANYWYLEALGVLMATALLDLLLYYVMGTVVVCYRCLAQHRGFERQPHQEAFDLSIGERYRQERIRLEQLRRSAQSAASKATEPVSGPSPQ
jgi:hypothetical protein